MRFRTRWLGYGPDDDTQQSYASLKNNLVFHKYCREQNLTKLIGCLQRRHIHDPGVLKQNNR
jgi:hypothetical protein